MKLVHSVRWRAVAALVAACSVQGPAVAQCVLGVSDDVGGVDVAVGEAISRVVADGSTALVSRPVEGGALGQGTVTVFERTALCWTAVDVWLGVGPPWWRFGAELALDGDVAFVGACHDGWPGEVSVFERAGLDWSLVTTLASPEPQSPDWFGCSIAVDGDTALVGARRTIVGGVPAGKVFVYERSGVGWLFAGDWAPQIVANGEAFGTAVALEGDFAVVTQPSLSGTAQVHFFQRAAGVWSLASSYDSGIGAEASFGASVALSGARAVVGAPTQDDDGLTGAGLAHAFERMNGAWTYDQEIRPLAAETGALFGAEVEIAGEELLVLASGGGVGGELHRFERVPAEWEHRPKVTAARLGVNRLVSTDLADSEVALVLAEEPIGDGTLVDVLVDDGQKLCLTTTNSTGFGAKIATSCDTSVSGNSFRLDAGPVPDQPGIFAYGIDPTFSTLGNGYWCIDGEMYRVPAQTVGGVMSTTLDFAAPPAPSALIVAGSRWVFQAWYRDPAAGGAQTNTSDAIIITFRP